jgi:hypothetical protein
MAVHDDPRSGGDESLHLPVLGLYADMAAGCGSVCVPDVFQSIPTALQAGILDDWLRGLTEIRNRLAAADCPAASLQTRQHGAR